MNLKRPEEGDRLGKAVLKHTHSKRWRESRGSTNVRGASGVRAVCRRFGPECIRQAFRIPMRGYSILEALPETGTATGAALERMVAERQRFWQQRPHDIRAPA
jgi:hypothetical protein